MRLQLEDHLPVYELIEWAQESCEVGIIKTILQVKKLRLREVTGLKPTSVLIQDSKLHIPLLLHLKKHGCQCLSSKKETESEARGHSGGNVAGGPSNCYLHELSGETVQGRYGHVVPVTPSSEPITSIGC